MSDTEVVEEDWGGRKRIPNSEKNQCQALLWNRPSSLGVVWLSPGILSSQDGPVLGAVGSFSWSGGAFLYPQNTSPTFINMSQENVDMRDSYLGETRLWLGAQVGHEPGKGRGSGVGRKPVC